jgi:hypothetical protein
MSLRGDQQAYFERLRAMLPMAKQGVEQTLFLCRNRNDNRPGAWVDADFWDWNVRPDFRTLLWNELCFDFDHPNWRYNWTAGLRLWNYNHEHAIPQYWFASAGKGMHCCIFMDVAGRQGSVGWAAIRAAAYNHLCKAARVATDPMKVYWRDTTMGSLLRMEGGLRFARPKTLDALDETFKDGQLVLYKHWIDRPPREKPLVTRPGRVEYPPSLSLWRFPMEWMPEPEVERPYVPHETTSDVRPIIRKLIEYMAQGGDLNDFGRFAVAVHLLRAGYTVEETAEMYQNTPDYNPSYTRRRLESLSVRIDSVAVPGTKAILERCGQQVESLNQ